MWQLNSRQVYDQAAADQIGATAPHINVDRIANYWLALPPFHEQVAIARHIEDRCRSLEHSIERISRRRLSSVNSESIDAAYPKRARSNQCDVLRHQGRPDPVAPEPRPPVCGGRRNPDIAKSIAQHLDLSNEPARAPGSSRRAARPGRSASASDGGAHRPRARR